MSSSKSMHKGVYYLVGLLSLLLIISLSVSFFKQAKSSEDKVVDIQSWQTKNGVPVFFVSSKQLPMVDISILFDAGSRRDGGAPGLASLTNSNKNE